MEDDISRLDRNAVPDEYILLRSCSSLVRKSASGQGLELAHFTVKEFLLGIEPDSEFSAYRVDTEESELELGKACLTYLTLQDFNSMVSASRETLLKRRQEYAFRHYAVRHCLSHARGRSGNPSLLALIQKLLDPSKPWTFITWTHDHQFIFGFDPGPRYPSWPIAATEENQRGDAAVATNTALHYASAFALPEICKWLLDCGYKVDHMSWFGTPIHHAVRGITSLVGSYTYIGTWGSWHTESILKVIDILLEAGADPRSKSQKGFPPLYYASRNDANSGWVDRDVILRLLQKGARYTDENAYGPIDHPTRARRLMDIIGSENLHEDDYAFMLKCEVEEYNRFFPRGPPFPLGFRKGQQI